MELPSVELQNLIWMVGGGLITFIFQREKRLLKVEAAIAELGKDINGIALYIGTPRALGKKLASEQKLEEKA